MNENKFQWQPLIEMIIVLVTILGSTIPLYIHTDSKISASNDRLEKIYDGIRQDMRDFHARLCLIEERYKEKK